MRAPLKTARETREERRIEALQAAIAAIKGEQRAVQAMDPMRDLSESDCLTIRPIRKHSLRFHRAANDAILRTKADTDFLLSISASVAPFFSLNEWLKVCAAPGTRITVKLEQRL